MNPKDMTLEQLLSFWRDQVKQLEQTQLNLRVLDAEIEARKRVPKEEKKEELKHEG